MAIRSLLISSRPLCHWPRELPRKKVSELIAEVKSVTDDKLVRDLKNNMIRPNWNLRLSEFLKQYGTTKTLGVPLL